MSDIETQLLAMLKARSFRRTRPGEAPFRLASGELSDYYIDGKLTEVFSEGAWLIGEVIYEHTVALNVDAIGGLEVGAVPLTTAAVISYRNHGKQMEGFWVRDAVKAHGTRKLIEGNLKPRGRVVIVDDVFTKGTSALKALKAVQEHGSEVVMVLAIVDRLQGAEQAFRREGVANYRSVFTIRDFGVADHVGKEAEAAAH
jgi:orotate phosphoribosyltransferase